MSLDQWQGLTLFGLNVQHVLESPAWQPMRRDLDVLEVWSGCASIARAASKRGLQAEAFDKINSPSQDILTAVGFSNVVRMSMRLRVGGLLAMAPVCKSFGFANVRNTKRKRDNVQGDTEYAPVRDGNAMALAAAFLFNIAVQRGVRTSIENPAGSMMFSFLKPYYTHLPNLATVIVDRCAFADDPDGQRCKKPYKFLGSGVLCSQRCWLLRPVALTKCILGLTVRKLQAA